MAEPTTFDFCTVADGNADDQRATSTNAPTGCTPHPINLLKLPPDVLTTIAHKAHPSARLVCSALAAASPPISAVCPTALPPPASLLPALISLCHRHAHTVTALDLRHVAPFHAPAPFLALAAALPHLASVTIRHCPDLHTAIHTLPPLFALPHLTHLDINECDGCIGVNQLQNLTESATALRSLSLEISAVIITNPPSTGPPAITSLSRLQSLTHLRLTTDNYHFPAGPPRSVMALLLDATARLPDLQSLSLRKCLQFESSWAVAQLLCRHTMLTELHISLLNDEEDDDLDLHALTVLRSLGAGLRRLSLSEAGVEEDLLDNCVGCLTGLQALRLGRVGAPWCTLCQVPALQHLTGLTALQLFLAAVEGEDDVQVLLPLAGHLRALELNQFYLGHDCLPGLARLTSLTKLALIVASFDEPTHQDTSEGFQVASYELQLSALRALRVLHLEFAMARWVTRSPEVAMATLGPLTSLTALTVDNCDLRGDVLAAGWLATMRQLEILAIDVNESTLTGAGQQALFALPRLRELAFPVVTGMDLNLLKQMAAAAPAPRLLRVRPLYHNTMTYSARLNHLNAIHKLLGKHGITVVATPDDPDL